MVRNHMIIHAYAKDEKLEKKRTAFRYYAFAGMAGVSDCLFSLPDLLAAYEHNLTESRWDKALEMCETLLDSWFNHFSEDIAPTLLLNGNDVMSEFNLIPNPMVGNLLAKLEEEQAAGIIQSREQAVDYIRREISKSSHQEKNGNGEIIL
jgi:hypothetical protein